MLLWEVLVNVKGEYDRAKAEGHTLEWLADRLPRCFVRTTEGNAQFTEVPHDWEQVSRTFDDNYDVLFRLAQARKQTEKERGMRAKKPSRIVIAPRFIRPTDEPIVKRALANLRVVVMMDVRNSAEMTFQFSADYHLRGDFNTLEEFWQVAFISLFKPEWLPWRGSYCAGCGKPLLPTAKLKKPSGTKLCSGCRVKKSRERAKRKRRSKSKTTNL